MIISVNAPDGYVQTTLEKQFSECVRNEVDEIKFWQIMLEDFKDDTNKLVFADWLQDRADPRSGALRLLVKYQTIPFKDSVSNPSWYLSQNHYSATRVMWKSSVPPQWFNKLSKYDRHFMDRDPLTGYESVYSVSYKTLSGAICDLVHSYLKLNDRELDLVNNWERK